MTGFNFQKVALVAWATLSSTNGAVLQRESLFQHHTKIVSRTDRPVEWSQWDTKNPTVVCDRSYDNPQQRAEVWWGTGAGFMLDNFIESTDPTDPNGRDMNNKISGKGEGWFNNFVHTIVDPSVNIDCTSLQSNCLPPKDCKWFLENKGTSAPFWILQQVSTMHSAFREINSALKQDGAINTTLEIPQIIKTFELPADAKMSVKDIFSLIGSAFGAAVPFMGESSPLAPFNTAASIFGGLFSLAGAAMPSEEEKIDAIQLNQVVQKFFTQLDTSLRDTLENILGNGDQHALAPASQSEQDDYTTETARFFAGGKWLISNVGVALRDFIKEGRKNLQIAVIGNVLQQQKWFIVQMKDQTPETCADLANRGSDFVRSATWVAESNYPGCYMISHTRHVYGSGGDLEWLNAPPSITEDQSKALVQSYGANLHDIYLNAIECAYSDPNATPDYANFAGILLNNPGLLSKCMYPFTVQRAAWNMGGWQYPYFIRPEGEVLDESW